MSEQLRFAAEFVTFLVAAAGFAMVVLRPELLARTLPTRVALGAGFALLALSAFLSGSLLVSSPDVAAVVVPRIAGALLTGVGASGWAGAPRPRAVLVLGVLLVLASVPFDGTPAATLLVGGGVAFAVALLASARRSIAARVAASAAAALLVLVLVLSVALSAVLTATVEQEAVERLEGRARQEARAVENALQETALPAARVAAASLEGDALDALRAIAAAPSPNPDVARRLDALSSTYLSGRQLAYVAGDNTVVGQSASAEAALIEEVVASDVVSRARAEGASGAATSRPEGTAVVVANGRAAAVAVTITGFTRTGDPTFQALGAVVAVVPIDATYLRQQRRDDDRLVFAVATPEEVLASAPGEGLPAERELRSLTATAVKDADGSKALDGHYAAAAAIDDGSGEPVAAVLVATDRGFVDDTRDTIFRTLFLIALGSTLLALLFAAVVGDRIGSGLRRLTTVARAVRAGDLSARSEIRTDDEVGLLSGAFDTMVTSLAEQSDALAAAAQEEASLRNRVEAIVQGMGEALVAVDASGVVTDVNSAAEDLLAKPAAELRGQPLGAVMTLVSEDDPRRDLVARIGSAERWSAVGVLGEAEVPVAVTATALVGADGAVGGVVLLRDLREERALDTMQREFLSRVGHELRTPLAIITGYSRILSTREADTERVQEWAGYISGKARELERIIEMLEFFAASTAGHAMGRRQEVDLRKLVADAVERWADRMGGTRSVRGRIARSPVVVHGVPGRLSRSIDELIDNALKFSPPTSAVSVSLRTVEGEAVITVTDRGKGMTAEEVEAAFEAFIQGDTSDTRHFGGLGLGLSFAQRVVESHGGRVTIDSTPAKGSRVSIRLPLPEQISGGTTV
ncbi:MAG: ATP-binding protein [Acidimicrobiia bacterium]